MRRLTICEYQLPIENKIEIEMPIGAKILSLLTHDGFPFILALVDKERKTIKKRIFRTLGTNHKMFPNEKLKYIGTYQFMFVYHIFEEIG